LAPQSKKWVFGALYGEKFRPSRFHGPADASEPHIP